MQTLEAIISFMFFLFFATYMLAELDYTKPNYALYQYQLANDVWRVLYLKGALKDFSSTTTGHLIARTEMENIGELTGFCIYLQGIQTTNCLGNPGCSENNVEMKKTWFDGGIPKEMTFTVCTPES